MEHRSFHRLACVVLGGAVLALLAPLTAEATIYYQVSLERHQEHLISVTMTVPESQGQLVVQMPAWNALYQIRDFAHRVQQVRARRIETDRQPVELVVRKRDKLTWVVTSSGTIQLDYSVFWDDPGPFSSQLNSEHAFLNLAMVLFYVPERRWEPVRVEFTGMRETWRVAAALLQAGTATFTAPNYDALVDAPVEIGEFSEFRFAVNEAKIRVVIHGSFQREKLEAELTRIVGYQTHLMRDVPFDEFLFLFHFGQGGGGGMEHANSTAIFRGSSGSVAGVSAHEFFHLWNVKRIRPESLEPVDYTRENYTRALWFAEGVTSTYTDYTLVRSGIWSPQQFYDSLARNLDQLESRPAHRWKSAEEASLDAWHEGYALYREPGFSISYYNKGYLLGVLLDILIRDLTGNRASLDDVMRYLNQHYAKQGRYYEESAGIRRAVEAVVSSTVGARDADRAAILRFFARYVAGTEPLPAAEYLMRAGLRLDRQGSRYVINELPAANELQQAIRHGLIRGTTQPK